MAGLVWPVRRKSKVPAGCRRKVRVRPVIVVAGLLPWAGTLTALGKDASNKSSLAVVTVATWPSSARTTCAMSGAWLDKIPNKASPSSLFSTSLLPRGNGKMVWAVIGGGADCEPVFCL